MKGICIFAHPDDSFIFAHNIRSAHPEVEWWDLCLTYRPEDRRGRDFIAATEVMNSKPLMAGLLDDMYFTPSPKDYADNIRRVLGQHELNLRDFDYIVTHNPVGEYGHGHHKAVSSAVRTMCRKASSTLWMPAHNWKPAATRLTDPNKLTSPCIGIFESEHFILFNFDLINEGFCEWAT